jgi:hypothetical protein
MHNDYAYIFDIMIVAVEMTGNGLVKGVTTRIYIDIQSMLTNPCLAHVLSFPNAFTFGGLLYIYVSCFTIDPALNGDGNSIGM